MHLKKVFSINSTFTFMKIDTIIFNTGSIIIQCIINRLGFNRSFFSFYCKFFPRFIALPNFSSLLLLYYWRFFQNQYAKVFIYKIYGHCPENKMYPINAPLPDAINLRMSVALVDTQFLFSAETSENLYFYQHCLIQFTTC